MTAAVGPGLTSEQVRASTAGISRRRASPGTRTYGQILRQNVFTFYNNVLFVIGVSLLALGRTNDALVSVGLGLVNALISSGQEMRAKRKLDALKLLHRSRARVVRDQHEVALLPEELVAGDLLLVGAGEQVLVDGPVEGPGRIEVDESLLTGESRAVVKVDGDQLLSGSVVISGETHQRAVAVGPESYAESVTSAAQQWTVTKTPLQRQIDLLVRVIILIVGLMSMAILGQAVLENLPLVRLVQISAVLSGLVPYGLFFLIAVAYAVGAADIYRRGALVQQTNAIESLSNVDVVCTDKTGTLTTGRLELLTIHPLADDVARTELETLVGEVANSAGAANATTTALAAAHPATSRPVGSEVAFASVRRWSGLTFGDAAGGTYVLGAVQALEPALAPGSMDPVELMDLVRGYAERGQRVLVFGRSADPEAGLFDPTGDPRLPPLVPLALLVLGDELRPHVRETLADLTQRGVAVAVVSGDDPSTVAALAAQLGLLEPEPLSGADLAALEPAAFDEAVQRCTVFGRVAPEQKEQIVAALVRAGRYVAMIGDGVNDIRSLKRTHVGIAMESGSTVARDVADLVLLKDSFAALPAARQEGQRIIGGLSVALKLFLSRVAVSILIIVGVGILGLGFPYEPAQVALTLFTVGLPSVFLTLWAKPERPDPHLIANLLRFVGPVAVVTGLFAVGIYAAFATLIARGLETQTMPSGAVGYLEAITGVARTDATFVEVTSVLVAQTGLSMFTALTAFVLVVFLVPPGRFFAAWAPVSADRRPAWLAAGLAAVFVGILFFGPTARYFDLVQPGGFILPLVLVAIVVWFFALRATWRLDLLRRAVGLPAEPRIQGVVRPPRLVETQSADGAGSAR